MDLGTFDGIVRAISEALVVAVVLALAVDPFVQLRFAEEWGEGVFWAIFNADAPPELRGAVNDVADRGYFEVRTEWHLTLDWVGSAYSAIDVTCRTERRLRSVDKYGRKNQPSYVTGIVDTCEGSPSAFTTFEYHGTNDKLVVLTRKQINECTAVDLDTGSAVLNPTRYLKHIELGYGEEATATTAMKTRLRAIDSIPLFTGRTSLRWMVYVHGSAVADLDLQLFGSKSGGIRDESDRTTEDGGDTVSFSSEVGAVTFPGHGLVLDWRPKRGAVASDTAEAL